jgi:hypothetical protein
MFWQTLLAVKYCYSLNHLECNTKESTCGEAICLIRSSRLLLFGNRSEFYEAVCMYSKTSLMCAPSEQAKSVHFKEMLIIGSFSVFFLSKLQIFTWKYFLTVQDDLFLLFNNLFIEINISFSEITTFYGTNLSFPQIIIKGTYVTDC